MARRLNTAEPGFDAAFAAFLAAPRGAGTDVDAVARGVVEAVRREGFAALARYTQEFDRLSITEESSAVSSQEIDAAVARCAEADLDALRLAHARLHAYHARQIPKDHEFVDEAGVTLGWRWSPIAAVGLYAPGGRASYPSSVLMNAVPAKVAGVERLVLVTPTPDGVLNPLVLAAARLAGVTEIYRVGGAQAVAALAYGAGPLAPVDKIVGPGNAYVTAAKRLVFGAVGIDTIAGPSEILVIADAGVAPEWIAADLLSQAEHDPAAQSILITDDAAFADAVERAIEVELRGLTTRDVAAASWRAHGCVIIVDDLEATAPGLADQIAAEHVEIATSEPRRIGDKIRHAGALFLGRLAPEALGDYVSGSNHVLPTARAARFASGLSVLDFVKRTSVQGFGAAGLAAIGPAAARLARAEGLPAHARSVELRLKS